MSASIPQTEILTQSVATNSKSEIRNPKSIDESRRLRVVSPAFVRQVHRQGQVMQVWVVDEREDVLRLLDWGVDGIISDRPDIAIRARDEWLKARS